MGAGMIREGEADIAFNIAGGLHHAGRKQASGFCYVNDPVLAILVFLERGLRVMYLDIDAHHGDGVQWAFYEDPRVLTISFHQDGRTLFPGTGSVQEMGKGKGLGFSVNVPMYPGTDDSVFWEGFSRVVPRFMDQFKPDVIVSQLGVDAFWNDPLASLELTTHGFCRVISTLADQGKPWLALGGGGYHMANVARAWTLAWAMMNQVELPEEIPHDMLGPIAEGGHHGNKLRDSGDECRRRDACVQFMTEVLTYLEQKVLPKIHV
jgi:acetoin utilization protein AcuC